MREALDLARRGLESVSPNPMVGAVLVRRGRILGRGYHRRFGGKHAEVDVLSQVTSARGADLYINLEPCGHHGKTPPCAEALIKAGIRRVFYAGADPNSRTRGRGPRLLRRAGVEIRGGLLRAEAEKLNAPFLHYYRRRQPWVILKWAMTLDGKIATATGDSRWITGGRARAAAHALRRRVDAILVGTGTALTDDPLLTPRPARGRRPYRVVLDRQGRLPLNLRLLQPEASNSAGPRLYATSRRASGRRLRILDRRGIDILTLPEARGGGGLDLDALLDAVSLLGVSQVMVEGGGALAGSFLKAGLVREVAAFVAPCLLGGKKAPSPVEGRGMTRLLDAERLERVERRWLGDDLLIQGVVRGKRGRRG